MNMADLLSIVLALTILGCAIRMIQLKKANGKHRRVIRHLERSVEKLNSRNGKLWFRVMQSQAPDYRRGETGISVTKL